MQILKMTEFYINKIVLTGSVHEKIDKKLF